MAITYWALLRDKLCPKRASVVLKYYATNWSYYLYTVLLLSELIVLTGYLIHLYEGAFITKPLTLYVGPAMFFIITGILFLELQKPINAK